MPRIDGIHHVTAIASDPQPNLDFYVRFLGLRFVKRTVNFDDPGTYHFYYGDETGQPGTILTFFPWPGARRGRIGSGQVTATSFSVGRGGLEFWRERAARYSVTTTARPDRFGEPVLELTDGDGLVLELIETDLPTSGGEFEIPVEFAIRNIHSATLKVPNEAETAALLTDTMGLRQTGRDENRVRFEAGAGGPSCTIYLLIDPAAQRGLGGAGTVHHIAFRTPDDENQREWYSLLTKQGRNVSPIMDRNYFHSIYYREPAGILFEIATDPPGFTVDEPLEQLGSSLKLPPEYESMRDRIEAALPTITVPSSGLLAESY